MRARRPENELALFLKDALPKVILKKLLQRIATYAEKGGSEIKERISA